MHSKPTQPTSPRGRGAAANTAQRFAQMHVDYDEGGAPAKVGTQFYVDHSSSIITKNDSPDLSFEGSINPYRGCEHGCAYCYARPTHEYLGFSAGLDFESRIMVKPEAPRLLREALLKPSYQPLKLSMSGVTDCYQPVEKKLRITRACLEVLAEFRHPVVIITKNHLITRDIDLLAELAQHRAVGVYLSVTSLDPKLGHVLEPRASSPQQRLEAIRKLHEAGVPVGVSAAPVIPALNDHEIPAILDAACQAGASFASYTMVRLPFSVKDVFATWLAEHFPERKEKILGRIRESQGETLSHGDFGKRLRGVGVWSAQIEQIFRISLLRSGIAGQRKPEVTAQAFRRPVVPSAQLELGL
ncbi:MAG: PA0069 family radical SAM protein [Roseimicrobium sp.]